MTDLVQIAGYIGAALLALAYLLIAQGRVKGASKAYHFINLTGAVLIATNTFYFGAIGPGLLNVIWALIALYHLFKV